MLYSSLLILLDSVSTGLLIFCLDKIFEQGQLQNRDVNISKNCLYFCVTLIFIRTFSLLNVQQWFFSLFRLSIDVLFAPFLICLKHSRWIEAASIFFAWTGFSGTLLLFFYNSITGGIIMLLSGIVLGIISFLSWSMSFVIWITSFLSK